MKAYIIVRIEVQDPATYEKYRAQVPAVIEKYGGRFLVRGGQTQILEGEWPDRRMVVLEFPSMEAAQAFYHAPEYAPLKALRQSASRAELVIVEGI